MRNTRFSQHFEVTYIRRPVRNGRRVYHAIWINYRIYIFRKQIESNYGADLSVPSTSKIETNLKAEVSNYPT